MAHFSVTLKDDNDKDAFDAETVIETKDGQYIFQDEDGHQVRIHTISRIVELRRTDDDDDAD